MNQNGIIIPGFRYKDAPAMIEWLEKAFGFEKHLVVEGENNTIEHAQLTLGNSMIMLGSEKHQRDYDQLFKTPPNIMDALFHYFYYNLLILLIKK